MKVREKNIRIHKPIPKDIKEAIAKKREFAKQVKNGRISSKYTKKVIEIA